MSGYNLDLLKVETPCRASWDEMAGDRRVRFCERCGRNVHNLSAMTREEAEQCVAIGGDRICVRFDRPVGGRLITLDYQRRHKPRLAWLTAFVPLAVVSALAGVFAIPFAAPTRTMGMVSCPPGGSPSTATVPATNPVAGDDDADVQVADPVAH
jgi:hypothetical protein